jgi:hypothetical protein
MGIDRSSASIDKRWCRAIGSALSARFYLVKSFDSCERLAGMTRRRSVRVPLDQTSQFDKRPTRIVERPNEQINETVCDVNVAAR